MGQLPSGSEGTAAGVLIYTLLCLAASSIVIWLTWHHRERNGYVAFLAYFTTLSTLCSAIQQIHGILRWNTVITDQFANMQENFGNPELVISNSAVGLDLVLYYIQFYCYNVEAMLVMFWGWVLVQSMYQLTKKPRLKNTLKVVNQAGLGFSVLFPLITVSCLQAESVRNNTQGFMLLAGQPLLWSIGLGSVALLLVFFRYVQSQRRFKRITMENLQVSAGSSGSRATNRKTMYDRWLIIRFTIAFFVLAAFEITIVLFSMTAADRVSDESQSSTPDFSAEHARHTSLLYMPGATPSLMLFIVFATTKPCIEHMKSWFRPKRKQGIERLPTTTSPILSPTSSTRSYDILKPINSYQSLLRNNGDDYGTPKPRPYVELRMMKPLPPTPEEPVGSESQEIRLVYVQQSRHVKPERLDRS